MLQDQTKLQIARCLRVQFVQHRNRSVKPGNCLREFVFEPAGPPLRVKYFGQQEVVRHIFGEQRNQWLQYFGRLLQSDLGILNSLLTKQGVLESEVVTGQRVLVQRHRRRRQWRFGSQLN